MVKIFSIEGNIGSGKSTLIEYLKKQNVNYYYLEEPVSVWNEIKDLSGVTILEKYYKNPVKYSFSFQMMAYISRLSFIKHAIANLPSESIIISERSIYTDREIFAKMLYEAGTMEHIEYSIYLKWFDEFKTFGLDGIIYVQTSPETCNNRILERNRKGEESIPLEYLESCHEYHEQWINNTCLPILYIDGAPGHSVKMVELIKQFVENNLKK
jgi:deoxyadenosine/deoxycytidine kinase